MKFILEKTLDIHKFSQYLVNAQQTNQFTNGGFAVTLLEKRARDMLKISADKSVIATSSGASAIQAIMASIYHMHNCKDFQSQDFTFPCNFNSPFGKAEAIDIDEHQQIKVNDFRPESTVIVTNCFGHLQNIDKILERAEDLDCIPVFDNAACPYSFWYGSNSLNYGVASYVSLHHTKPIGFGEGGLIIIDKEYDSLARSMINFGKHYTGFRKFGINGKMSELSAAGILQWWDSFDIEELAEVFRFNYKKQLINYSSGYNVFTNYAKEHEFFPNCLPLIKLDVFAPDIDDPEVRRYYDPWLGLPNSNALYNRIQCVPIA